VVLEPPVAVEQEVPLHALRWLLDVLERVPASHTTAAGTVQL